MKREIQVSSVLLALVVGCYSGGGGGAATDSAGASTGASSASGTSAEETGEMPVEPGERLDVRVWRLSPTHFTNAVTSLLGDGVPEGTLPEGATDHGISNIAANDGVDVGNVSVIDDVTRGLGSWAADNGPASSRCGDAYGSETCIDEFLAWFVPAAYRRPATDSDLSELRAVFDANETEHGYDYAYGSVVRTALLSPDFLYRTEVGPPGSSGKIVLTEFEIASAIAFPMTEQGPDEALLKAARDGELTDPDEREKHVRRLMAKTAPLWQRLFREWLGITRLATAAEGSGISADLVAQMEEEFARFVSEVAVEQRGSMRDVFTAPYTWAGPELAALYGVDHPGGGMARIELDPDERAGLLTMPAWLASHATIRDDYVVRRGMGIFRDALCNDIEPPNIDVEEENSKLTEPDATVREVVEARAGAANCGVCHALPDPIGFAFEPYDNAGQLRTSYATGNPIESDVDVPGLGAVEGGADLARALVEDERFQACFARRFAHVFVGQDTGPPDGMVWTREVFEAFVAADTSLEELLVAFVRHDAFIERNKGGN